MAHVGLDASHQPIGRPQKLVERWNAPVRLSPDPGRYADENVR